MKNKIKYLLNTARRLIEVPFCASCSERLSPFPQKGISTSEYVCLCADCAAKWHMAKSKMCPKCAETAEKCVCTPKFFKKYQEYIPAVCFYANDGGNVPSNTVLTFKHKKCGDLSRFLASELAPKIRELLKNRDISSEDLIITWIPRQRKNIKKYGFDQGERLAYCLSKELGAALVPIFKRRSGKEQKNLDKTMRRQNAESSIALRAQTRFMGKKADIRETVENRSLIIVDDIITTGATLRRGALLALPLKPKNLVCATVAKSTLNKE